MNTKLKQTKLGKYDPHAAMIRLVRQIMAIADAIRELKTVPSGVFYSQICTEISLSAFDSILKILQKQKLVTVENHVITWIGPDKA